VRSIRAATAALTPQHWFLLWILGAASFFDGYDYNIVTVALTQIRDTFDLTQAEISLWLMPVYAGALPALFISRWSDRYGRRRLLLITIIGYTVFTGITAVVPSIEAYAAAQFGARLFLNAEAAIVWTMAAEELPAESRGFGFGWLAMLNALGTGLGSIVFATVFAPLGISWRWLYVVGIPPLLAITYLRRRLPESRRFEQARNDGRLAERWHEILRRPHLRWLVLVCITALLGNLLTQAGVFVIDFMQTDRGLSASAANLVLVGAGAAAVPFLVWAGSLSDKYGRKVVGCGFAVLGMVGGAAFFLVDAGAVAVAAFLMLMLVGQFGAWPTLGAFNTELFPTALRGQAGSWATVFRTLGQVSSFGLASLLITLTGSLPQSVLILAGGPLVTVIIIAVFFPETKGRELEEISGEPTPFDLLGGPHPVPSGISVRSTGGPAEAGRT
jgi:putative MFS transporter